MTLACEPTLSYFQCLKGTNFQDEDILVILRSIKLNDISGKAKAKKDAKRDLGIDAKGFAKLWRSAHPFDDRNVVECDESLSEILFQYNLSKEKFVRMRTDGIYLTNNKSSEEGDVYILEEHLITWESFKITGRFLVTFGLNEGKAELDESYHQEWHYNGILNGFSFLDLTEEHVKALLLKLFTASSGRDYITGVLHLALNDPSFAPDISHLYRNVIGFTAKGWTLPDKYFFPIYDDISRQVYYKLKKVLSRAFNKDELILRLQKLYQTTGIEHKDIMFAWATYAPFGMAIRDLFGLLCMLDVTGNGDFGKSPMLYIITCLFYGHMDAPLGDSVLQSYSSAQSWMSSSTFPIPFDDNENMIPEITHEIKTYTTQPDYMAKKGGGPTKQFYTVYKPYCANIAMSNNRDPIAFSDPFFRERSIYIIVSQLRVDPEWLNARQALEAGDFLLLLYDYTKEWTIENIKTLIQSFTTEGLTDERNKKIIRFMKFGAYLFEQILGIKLDLSAIKDMILMNNEINTIELVEAVRTLARLGKTDDNILWRPRSWVNSPLRRATYQSKEGVVIDLDNIRDLQNIVEGNTTRKWTLQIMFQKLCPKIFKNALSNVFVYADTQSLDEENNLIVQKQKTRGIFIPKDDLIVVETPPEKTGVKETKIDNELTKIKEKEDQDAKRIYEIIDEKPFMYTDIYDGLASEMSQERISYILNRLKEKKWIYETNQPGYFRPSKSLGVFKGFNDMK